ncbi:MAG: hypothetical protein H7Y17_12370 [Chlorobia bacterium]|nr:hypothetical protein [Fimbriimonadaceae bacterium]
MKSALALAIAMPFVSVKKSDDEWQPFTSMFGRVRFEMPTAPAERHFATQAGTEMRSYASKKSEVVYEATAMEMMPDLQLVLQEAVSESEVSVSRQVLDGWVESYLDDLKVKPLKTEYAKFQKLNSRVTTALLPGDRQIKLMSVVGKQHMYMFSVSYPKSSAGDPSKRFYESIRFEN